MIHKGLVTVNIKETVQCTMKAKSRSVYLQPFKTTFPDNISVPSDTHLTQLFSRWMNSHMMTAKENNGIPTEHLSNCYRGKWQLLLILYH